MRGLPKIGARVGRIFTVLTLLVVVVVGELIGSNSWLVTRMQQLVLPVVQLHLTLTRSVVAAPHSIQQQSTAARRIQDLEFRLSESYALLSELEMLKRENEQLRELAGAVSKNTSRIIAAPVVSFAQPAVAAGSEQGVVSGQMVLVAATLVGRISQVQDQQATVVLLSQSDSQPLLAQTESGIQGLVVGDGRRVMLEEIPLDSKVENGTRLTTVGQPGVPGGIFIGRVAAVTSNPATATQTIAIEQLVTFFDTAVVEIR